MWMGGDMVVGVYLVEIEDKGLLAQSDTRNPNEDGYGRLTIREGGDRESSRSMGIITAFCSCQAPDIVKSYIAYTQT
jgi:hypothetical protein